MSGGTTGPSGVVLSRDLVVGERYRVVSVLGSGAMATVYAVEHVSLGTELALKVLKVPNWLVQDRLLREGRIQGSLQHRNVVAVTDVVEIGGAPGLVMERVRGPSLDQVLKTEALTLAQAWQLGHDVLSGAAAAHAGGLIHRDLKPANVLVDLSGDRPVGRITDFGLAKLRGGEGDEGGGGTRTGMAMGTPAYMAPEQIRDAKSVDARADVFSLGAVLYELVTGERAYPGDDMLDLFSRIKDGDYRPVGELEPQLPTELVSLIEDALATRAEDRPKDASAMLAAWQATDLGPALWPPALSKRWAELVSEGELAPSQSEATFVELDRGPVAVVPEASAQRRVWPWVLAGGAVVALGMAGVVSGLAGVGGLWFLNQPVAEVAVEAVAPPEVFCVESAPTLTDNAAVQARINRGWSALLDARFEAAARELGEASAVVEDPALLLALFSARAATGRPPDLALFQQAAQLAMAAEVKGPREQMVLAVSTTLQSRHRGAADVHLEHHPNDALGKLMLASVQGWAAPEERAELVREVGAELAGPQVLAGAIRMEAGQLDVAEEELRAAHQRSGAARLLLGTAQISLHRGDFATAQSDLAALVAERPDVFLAAPLAHVAARMQWEESLDDLAAPGVPSSERLTALRTHAVQAELGLGMLDRATSIAELASGNDAAPLHSEVAWAAWALGDRVRATAAVETLQVAGALGEEGPLDARYTAALVRTETVPFGEVLQTLPTERPQELVNRLAALVMAHAGSVEPTHPGMAHAGHCRDILEVARIAEIAGHPLREELYQKLVEPDFCADWGIGRMAQAMAHVGLAELALEDDDPEAAKRHVDAHYQLWSEPELGHVLSARAAAVSETLAFRP